jgi:3-dehydroquinate synthase
MPPKMAVICETTLLDQHPSLAMDITSWLEAHQQNPSHLISSQGGESVKNDPNIIDQWLKKWDQIKLCRHSLVICIGGGALQDAVGYAASVFHRGLRLLRCPSTVLSQNDAGIGVKNGINDMGKKNFKGTFAAPEGVINDLNFLTTLAPNSIRAGYAEAVKVALLKDASFFDWIENHAQELHDLDDDAIASLIHRCARLHLEHIQNNGDPYEKGSSRPLDLGHWSAHKLESLSKHALEHGEAVALGIQWDALYAHSQGWLKADLYERIQNCFKHLGLPQRHHLFKQPQDILRGLEEFREHLGGQLTLPFIRDLAVTMEVNQVDEELYFSLASQLCP